MLVAWTFIRKPEDLLKELFVEILRNHPSEIMSEFSRYITSEVIIADKKEEQNEEVGLSVVRPPSHSLELNLMLVFIYMASR